MKKLAVLIAIVLLLALSAGCTPGPAPTSISTPTPALAPSPTMNNASTLILTSTPESTLKSEPVPGAEITELPHPPVTPTVKSEPVPGAEITVEQVPGPVVVKKCVTDINGEFSFDFFFVAAQGMKSSGTATLNLIITLPQGSGTTYQTDTNVVTIVINAVDGPLYTLGLRWQPPDLNSKTNKGSFAINPKAQS
jgi:hypothetical protein